MQAWSSKDLIHRTQQTLTTKEKINKWNFIKIKTTF